MPATAASAKRNPRAKHGAATPRDTGRRVIGRESGGLVHAVHPTSLKLPVALKSQIEDAANREGVSAHAFMLQSLSDAARRAQLREQFQQDSLEALREMQRTGMGYELGAVREYFSRLAAFRKGKGPKPRRPALTKMV